MPSTRPAQTPAINRYALCVPLVLTGIELGSAIVVPEVEVASDAPLLKTHYEGNRYDVEDLRAYAGRAKHAAGRALANYPTIAKAWLPRASLRVVGSYDCRLWRITAITDPAALAEWLGQESLPEVPSPDAISRRVAELLARVSIGHAAALPCFQAAGRWTGRMVSDGGQVRIEAVTEDGEGTDWLDASPLRGGEGIALARALHRAID